MRFFVLVLVLAAVGAIAKSDIDSNGQAGDISYPTPNTVWTVGEKVNVTFHKTDNKKETTSIFFNNDRQHRLGGGPTDQHVYHFTVLKESISPPNGTSLLLAVRRESNFLQSVDDVNVKVVPAAT